MKFLLKNTRTPFPIQMNCRQNTLRRAIHFCRLAIAVCLATGCAKVGQLSGGEKDTTPPGIDSTRSTRNFSTNFQAKKIELTFDEWVKLDNPNQQILISPPLQKRPEITLKGKTLRVQFAENELLRANTTYAISFNQAVKDLNESNAAKDLRFVFSTGPTIDSLRLGGQVVDAFSGQPVEGISIMLYEEMADSVVRKGRPYYFSKTEKTGSFLLQNLRPGSFRLVAIDDQNLNYRFEDGEKIGFFEQPIEVANSPVDSLKIGPAPQKTPVIRLFKNQGKMKLIGSESKGFGLARLFFSGNPSGIRPTTKNGPQLLDFELVSDSVYVWYDEPAGPFSLHFGSDSALVRPGSREDFLKKHRLAWADDLPKTAASSGRASRGKFDSQNQPGQPANPGGQPGPAAKLTSQNPAKPLELAFNFPVLSVDSSKILLADDSLKTGQSPVFSIKKDSLSPRKWLLKTAWRDGSPYLLTILPGGLTDFWGEKNADTLRRKIQVLPSKTLTTLSVSFASLTDKSDYLFELVSGETVVEKRVFQASPGIQKLTFAGLQAGQFTGRLTEDSNSNGRWDSGNFDENRQPERIFTQKFEQLKPNWEQEIEFKADVPGGRRAEKPKIGQPKN